MRINFFPWNGQVRSLFILLFYLSILAGCRRSAEELPLEPPATHPLTRDYIGYGVVNASFTHILNEPGRDGISRTYLRRGTLVRIIERRPVMNQGNSESWVLVEGNYEGSGLISHGWLPEEAVEIYDSESRAITASKAMNP